MELWLDARYIRAGYGWSFPAGDELRVGVGSFWPADHVKEPTVRLARRPRPAAPSGYQGNWIPHQLRRAVEDGVFFVGDSAGHCLPLTAEGIRTALYFGLACGRELRAVVEGRRSREQALARYAAFSDSHARKFRWLLAVQRAIGQITPSRAATAVCAPSRAAALRRWAFSHYLAIAPPSFVARRRRGAVSRERHARAAGCPPRWPARRGWRSRARARRGRGRGSHVAVAERVDADRPARRRAHQREPVDRRGQAHDRVQPRRHAGDARPGQVGVDGAHQRVAARPVAAAGLAQVTVVVAAFDQARQRQLVERRAAVVGERLLLDHAVAQALAAAPASRAAGRARGSC